MGYREPFLITVLWRFHEDTKTMTDDTKT